MIELPRALEAWRAELELFPDDVALSILPWLPRLLLAVGPLSVHSAHPSGEPDGFGGLTRRGPYERLLLSEWALGLEYPEELTRRAVMGELAFLELSRRQAAGSRRSVVLFDTGPRQLGAPRLAQLALLVVLAHRAREAGAELAWGVLGKPDGWLYDHVSEAAVGGLLAARTAEEPTRADLEDWLERIGPTKAPEDLWLVGDGRAGGLLEGTAASWIEVHDVLEPDARRLRTVVRRRGSVPAEVELELPPERAAVRILRDPFQVLSAEPTVRTRPLAPGAGLVISPDGRKIFARTEAGDVIMHVPSLSPGTQPGTPRRLTTDGEQTVAAGISGKEPFLVTSDSERLTLRIFSRKGQRGAVVHTERLGDDFPIWHPGAATPLQPAFVAPGQPGPGHGTLFLDAVGRLVFLAVFGARRLELVDGDVLALGQRSRRVLTYVRSATSGTRKGEDRHALALDSALVPRPIASELFVRTGGVTEAFLGPAGSEISAADPRALGFVVVRSATGHWRAHFGGQLQGLAVPEGATPIGALMLPPALDAAPQAGPELTLARAGVAVLEADRRTVAWVGELRRVPLFQADQAITFAAVTPTRGDVAYVTSRGELRLHSVSAGAEAYRARPEADDEDTLPGGRR